MLGLYIQHGRNTPDQQLSDWGENAPTLPNCIGIHSIYGNFYAYFASESAALLASEMTGWDIWDDNSLIMKFHGDLLMSKFSNGAVGYFSDWGLVEIPMANHAIKMQKYISVRKRSRRRFL